MLEDDSGRSFIPADRGDTIPALPWLHAVATRSHQTGRPRSVSSEPFAGRSWGELTTGPRTTSPASLRKVTLGIRHATRPTYRLRGMSERLSSLLSGAPHGWAPGTRAELTVLVRVGTHTVANRLTL